MKNFMQPSNGNQTMSSMEVAELTTKRHDHVIRDIRKIIDDLDAAGEDVSGFAESSRKDSYGRDSVAFELTYPATMILVSGYMVAIRSKIVNRWQDLEREAALTDYNIPKTLGDALRFAAEIEEQRIALVDKVNQDAPKVAFHDAVTSAANCHTLEQAAKVIGTGRNRLTRFLREIGAIMMSSTMPYQKYIDAGYFRVVETPWFDSREQKTRLSTKTLITGKGLDHIQRKIGITGTNFTVVQ